MAVAMRSNGLHHAVSLGTIEVASKPACSSHFDRSYDSEDENMSRRRLRHTSSTELYPRPSVYSKGDIREQYCLTDRQLNSIERPRRERFFGCLSRRGAPQSFLGVCVGRRVPSDENLAAYAPFHKYPRCQRPYHPQDDKSPDSDWDSSYFRRQPASILSTAKMPDGAAANRHSWMGSQTAAAGDNVNFANEQRARATCWLAPTDLYCQDIFLTNCLALRTQSPISKSTDVDVCSYHCPTHVGLPIVPLQMGSTTPRTKHVSFARSHTLTSFDDVNLGLRSSGRLKTARSQERLIGGKKPIIATGSIYESSQLPPNVQAQPNFIAGLPPIAMHQHQAVIHQHPHIHPHGHGHSHQHHHGPPIHIHQFVPQVQTEQPMSLIPNRTLMDELSVGAGVCAGGNMGGGGGGMSVLPCPAQAMVAPSPEVVIVEKKFRNAMKTQATQTELRKDGNAQVLALSPRTLHKVKVVSQGAQTNGLQNGKKLTKSLSEMPNGHFLVNVETKPIRETIDRGTVHRTQSEEPSKSPLDDQAQINYYEPPPPLNISSFNTRRISHMLPKDSRPYYPKHPDDTHQSIGTDTYKAFNLYVNEAADFDDSDIAGVFDYESNSLPRRACSFHRETEFSSNSLPRREPMHAHEICKHITECTELMADSSGALDFSKPHLLPPPSQYCKDDIDEPPVEPPLPLSLPPPPTAMDLTTAQTSKQHPDNIDPSRRMSMVVTLPQDANTPFRRDDLRRQSMPIYVKTEKLIDGFGPRTSFRSKVKHKTVIADADASDEKEIFIDFKPHVLPKLSAYPPYQNYRSRYAPITDDKKSQEQREADECESCRALEAAEQQYTESADESEVDAVDEEEVDADGVEFSADEDKDELESKDHLYENIPNHLVQQSNIPFIGSDKRNILRKRSVSLDEAVEEEEKVIGLSTPPSPCREELLANVSTYPSSDSLANDFTRDHSDGIWNESQVTVLTADQKDISDGSYSSNLLLTPTSKRKNLLLQHQQRSSIDTDALDLEEQLADHSPTYGVAGGSLAVAMPKSIKTTTLMPQQQAPREYKANTLSVLPKIVTPTIAVTSSVGTSKELSPKKSPRRRSQDASALLSEGRRSMDAQFLPEMRADVSKFSVNQNTDISECSTNTDEYATCTDTSKRTPGIKTPPTTTSSSSTTQVPVSTQSSQIDKTHGGSSFESASSLYSTRGDILSEDTLQPDEKLTKSKKADKEIRLKSPLSTVELTKRSPSHSISSTSSGSYNMAALPISSPPKDAEKKTETGDNAAGVALALMAADVLQSREKPKIKPESISDDERSEMRYSSSGYYESPHDDEHVSKFRRHRIDEDRKRRKTTMKLDIEKENMRALTSPIKKQTPSAVHAAAGISKDKLPEKQVVATVIDTASPNRIKRFRPKIRRQFRRTSRDDTTPKRQKNLINLYGLTTSTGSTEKLLDCSIAAKTEERAELQIPEQKPKPIASPTTTTTKSSSEVCQLKAKSIESLRSVSPGSDSVFYSEADGPLADQQGHCHHCGKEMEGRSSAISVQGGDSVESLPYIENDQEQEQDIVKPPSDFADSPVTTKTTQRLYKKMDKRFRSEERYHGERGRHYKSRQENIRAKSEERSRESVHTRSPHTLRPAGSSPCVLPDSASFEQSQQIIYKGHYDAGRYTRLTDADVWSQLDHQSFDRQRDRRSSTESERSFHSKYQVILHRLVQRRCTLEMYHRQRNSSFQLMTSNSAPESLRRKLEEILKLMLLVWARESHVLSVITAGKEGVDKTIVVKSDSGEFGFRIHGSKPVVVAAIEPDTPAESSGLEVGDIIIAVNGVQVLDKHHTEVVKIAHDGCETLELQVARTIGVLMHEQQEPPGQPIYSGYLWRQSGQAKGAPNAKKWVRRWFSLRPDNCLYYYKTEDDTQPVGAMIMAKHTVEHCPPECGKPYAFKVDAGEGIPMYVAADSEELANRWMKVLQQSAAQGTPWLDNCARNLYQTPSSIARPDCFGYLMKLGSRWCGWSKRYCVLKDACLYFYQDASSKNAFGMACLHGYKVSSMSTSASGKKNSFEIIPPEAKLRHYYFCTETEMDKKRWISALEYSIDRWIKSG